MNKAERIARMQKKIKKRVNIVKSIWVFDDEFGTHKIIKEPHRAHKYNLNCGCKMCHDYKYAGNSKKRKSFRDIKNNMAEVTPANF